jgi:hypothetical protein
MKAARKPIKTRFGWIKCATGQRETKFRGRRRANLFSCNIKKLTKIGPPSLCENSLRERFCSVDLQADIVDASTCPPEGGRYICQNPVLTRTPQSLDRKSHAGSGDL